VHDRPDVNQEQSVNKVSNKWVLLIGASAAAAVTVAAVRRRRPTAEGPTDERMGRPFLMAVPDLGPELEPAAPSESDGESADPLGPGGDPSRRQARGTTAGGGVG